MRTLGGNRAKKRWYPPLLLLLSVFLVSGCVGFDTLTKRDRLQKFDDSLKRYSAALRWGRYDIAVGFLRSRDGLPVDKDGGFNKDIHVTAYTVKSSEYRDDSKEIIVSAQISYYATDSGMVQVSADRGLWWYDDNTRLWFIDGGLPVALLEKGK